MTVRALTSVLALLFSTSGMAAQETQPTPNTRPRIGLALGGGSARGIAHIGVLRWLEDHRIPIDYVAGTSMGGLVGGAFAAGMSPDEIAELLRNADWDIMFLGDSPFKYKTFRRKEDARAYPSRIDFGWKKGFRAPSGLEPGQQIDLLLAKIALPYSGVGSFDELPTAFRCVATDVNASESVVLSSGSLARSLRATMAIPAVFGPVELDGRLLVDGGVLNNVPADVVRAMGADIVIAVDVGSRSDPSSGGESMFTLLAKTIDTMMIPRTREALRCADIVIQPELPGVTAVDWRRSDEIAGLGYESAEESAEVLMPLAIDAAAYERYNTDRAHRRRTDSPAPQFISIEGVPPREQKQIGEMLESQIGSPLDMGRLSVALSSVTGTDRYETATPELIESPAGKGLLVRIKPKGYGPPFISLAFDLDNTRSTEFSMNARARITGYDVAGTGSEIRADAGVGSGLVLAGELYRPLGESPWFIAPRATASRTLSNGYMGGRFAAEYRTSRAGVGFDFGLNTSGKSQLRIGCDLANLRTSVRVGDPLLPVVRGNESFASVRWTYDGQTSPIVPTRGVLARVAMRRFFSAADSTSGNGLDRKSLERFTSAETSLSWFGSLSPKYRLFVQTAGGTSSGQHPLPPNDFTLGGPLRLGAIDNDELRGSNYLLLNAGLLRSVGRLPDFLGGNIFLGGWVENGSVFERIGHARVRTNATAVVVLETFLGPAYAGGSIGFDGRGRFYVGIGPLFK
ncbi:MAG: patatin-like phospholipase family protein [Acidobacteria bacterium]|nr:patatin-like phospholipase family protein [Acidobacteriota bacterium]